MNASQALSLIAQGHNVIVLEDSESIEKEIPKLSEFVIKPRIEISEPNIMNQKEWWRKGNPRRKY